MDCLTDEQLASIIERHPAAEENPAWTTHLGQCASCQARLEQLAGGTDWIPEWDAGSPIRLDEPSIERYRAITQADNGDTFLGRIAAGPGENLGDASLSAFLSPTDRPGFRARFGPFYVIDVIGRGGMGIVFKAHDPALRRTVAVKVLTPQLAASVTARKRFLREARAAASVVNDHVVTIHSVGEVDGFPYLVMQFIEGESLETRLHRKGAMDIAEVVRIAEETAKGLQAAHDAGLVHRDIKPANILLEASTGRCKITDFGLARTIEDESLTRTGMIAGTPHYMAPEQALGEDVDHRTDLYSLGAVLFSACTGKPPYDGTTPLSVLSKVIEGPIPEVGKMNPNVPGWLEEVIRGLLMKKPDDRFQSADELLDRLGKRESAPVTAPRLAILRRAVVVCIGIIVLLMLAAFAVPWVRSSRLSESGTTSRTVRDSVPVESQASGFRVLHPNGTIETATTLREAVASARDGSSIEITSSNRIELAEPLDTQGKTLLIRAMAGTSPTIAMIRNDASSEKAILTANAPLALEGIEFCYAETTSHSTATPHSMITAPNGPLHVTNCRFDVPDLPGSRLSCLSIAGTAVVQNSIFSCGPLGTAIIAPMDQATQIEVENCAFLGDSALTIVPNLAGRPKEGEALRFLSCTVIGKCALHLLGRNAKPGQGNAAVGIRVEKCVFDVGFLCTAATGRVSDPVRAEMFALNRLTSVVRWSGSGNVYAIGRSYCGFSLGPRSHAAAHSGPQSLISWQDFCQEESDLSREAKVHFPHASTGARPEPGDPIQGAGFEFVLARDADASEKTPGLGASVETLGPGKPYETWRHSPQAKIWASRWHNAVSK